MTSEGKVRVDAGLDRPELEAREAGDLAARPRRVRELDQRVAAPQRERFAQLRRGRGSGSTGDSSAIERTMRSNRGASTESGSTASM